MINTVADVPATRRMRSSSSRNRRTVADHLVVVVLGLDLVEQIGVVLLQPAFQLGELRDALLELGIEPEHLRLGLLELGDVARRDPAAGELAVLNIRPAASSGDDRPPIVRST